MNTQTSNTKRIRAIRKATINKLCVALTEMTERLPTEKPIKDLYETFKVYCKRYNTNKNLWYSLKELGYITKSDNRGWCFKIKRQEINRTMATTIIENYNKKCKEYEDLRKQKANQPTKEIAQDVKPKAESVESKEESYLIVSKDFYDKLIASGDKYVAKSLDEIKNHKKEGDYYILKSVGKLKVVPTAYLEMD
jgi:hypothetical protein